MIIGFKNCTSKSLIAWAHITVHFHAFVNCFIFGIWFRLSDLSDKHTVIVSHGELLIEPKQQHKQIVNIETWTDAFFIFTSIYCTTHPLKFLKYILCIRLGSKRCSGGWKAYDEQFRLRMVQDPSSS